MRNQLVKAEASLSATSTHTPRPVARARRMAAQTARAPQTAPTRVPMVVWAGMKANPSASTPAGATPDQASKPIPCEARLR